MATQMVTQPLIKLRDGNLMPQLGLGVWLWQVSEAQQAEQTVSEALAVGYRLIDTAAIYANEEGVGAALKNSKIPRDKLFVTTKLWNEDQENPERALITSLKKLQLSYVDLYLIHWPVPKQDHYVSAWRKLIELQKQGLIKSIGVCNFNIPHLERLIFETKVAPVINQIELHPLLQQNKLHAWHAAHHIATESWSPLAQGGEGVFDQQLICQLAKKYNKTPAQIVIRWHLDNGLIAIPKSITPARIKENFDVFSFKLKKEELSDMTTLDIGKRLGPHSGILTKGLSTH